MKETPYFQCFCFLQNEKTKALEFLIWSNILSEIELGFFFIVGGLFGFFFNSEEYFVIPGP